ncbi:HD domain-containing protein [Paucibacter soli]|uniref:HD domain-containing protein n=1 Tax=Paucibacter soli TaxID=3133433 RepID=UPI0030B3E7A7
MHGHLRVWGEGAPEHHEVGLALWFHDLVYDPQAKDNEDRSIEAAKRVLGALGLDTGRIARVARLVEITKHGAVESVDATERLMIDIDLSILGAPPARFATYCEQVAIEYSWVPPELYKVKRRAFIEAMLARPQLFLTPIAYRDLEHQARENLEQERRQLV